MRRHQGGPERLFARAQAAAETKQMAEIALESLKNARRLYDDALLLREAGRLPSAFMTAGLAADELGKHVLVSSFFGAREETDEEWRKFWRRFRRHEEKLGDALMGAWAGDLLTDEPPPNISAFHSRRLASTYVDVSPDGAVVTTPSRLITLKEVNDLLDLLDQELRFCESMLAKATPEAFAKTLDGLRTSDKSKELRDLLAEGGAEAALAFAVMIKSGAPYKYAVAMAKSAKALFGHLRPQTGPGESN